MWKKNFLFRAHEAAPLKESENELFHDAEPALDSAGLQMEKFLSAELMKLVSSHQIQLDY